MVEAQRALLDELMGIGKFVIFQQSFDFQFYLPLKQQQTSSLFGLLSTLYSIHWIKARKFDRNI